MLPIRQRTSGHQLNDIIPSNLIIIPRLEEDTEGRGEAASSWLGRQMARQDGARQLLHILVVGLAAVLGIRIRVEPDPDQQDPHVFGPPGSGSISQRYGSGSFPLLINLSRRLK
jgi:hypothetical protein